VITFMAQPISKDASFVLIMHAVLHQKSMGLNRRSFESSSLAAASSPTCWAPFVHATWRAPAGILVSYFVRSPPPLPYHAAKLQKKSFGLKCGLGKIGANIGTRV
jgi:hypothetical protein